MSLIEHAPGDNEGQETWCAAVHGIGKTQTCLATEQQQQKQQRRGKSMVILQIVFKQ